MGLHDRDYYRNDVRTSEGWGGSGTVCRKIVLATVAAFVLQILTKTPGEASSSVGRWLAFNADQCFLQGQIWRMATYAFVHNEGDLWHVVGNMFVLWMFGPAVEAIYGSREFLRFYLVAAVVAALCQVGLSRIVDEPIFLMGASGAVLGVMMLFALHFPRQNVYILGVIPIEARWLVGLYALYDAFPVWQQLMGRGAGGMSQGVAIAHAAHLGGFLYGFLYWKLNLRQSMWSWVDGLFSWSAIARKRRQKATLKKGQVRVHRPEPDSDPMIPVDEDSGEFSERVDEVLKKISLQGEPALTAAERSLLAEAAERYKRRR